MLVVRHGERLDDSARVSNEERQETFIQLDEDIPLSKNGKLQARQTGEYLKAKLRELIGSEEYDLTLFSSPYVRCVQTAAGIIIGGGFTQKRILVREELSEFQFNQQADPELMNKLVINTLKQEDFSKAYLDQLPVEINYDRDYDKGTFKMQYPEGFDQCNARYLKFFKSIMYTITPKP